MSNKKLNTGEGIKRIAAERQRQIDEEGYDQTHDKGHAEELMSAALAYALVSKTDGFFYSKHAPNPWPWGEESWNPSEDRIRNLEKAGALIAAAIDSLKEAE